MESNNNPEEQPESGKEAYEAKKREKEAARAAQSQEQKKKTEKNAFLRYIAWTAVLIVFGVGVYVWGQSVAPQTEDKSRAVPVMSREHISERQSANDHNSSPPTSGQHYAKTAIAGFRERVIADEYLVHNLEHGQVWIAYHPELATSTKEALEQFVSGDTVVITPRPENEADIALAAWGRLDTFNVPNGITEQVVQRVDDFITRYRGKGPEQIPPGAHQGDI